jgi:hypothetical protein
MSVRYSDFQQEIALTGLIHRWNPNLNAELTAVATALATDPTSHDATIETPPAALKIGPDKTRLTNDLLIVVNKAKGGNLAKSSMIAAIDGVAGVLAPPGVIDTPYVSGAKPAGSVLTCTTGNWTGTPSSYAYAWKRDGTVAVGTSVNTYTTVAGDVAHAVGCIVSGTNATGTTAAPLSNQIVVT